MTLITNKSEKSNFWRKEKSRVVRIRTAIIATVPYLQIIK